MALRVVDNFAGVNDALREIYQFLDYYSTKNLDFHRRRITNASPSVDLYDYVVRKELVDRTGGGISQPPLAIRALTKGYDKITFGIAVGSGAIVSSNVTPPYVWSNSIRGRAELAFILANVPPTGSNLLVDILKNGISILDSPLVLVAGTTSRFVNTYDGFNAHATFSRSDVITANVTQIGSEEPGQDVTVVIFCKLI